MNIKVYNYVDRNFVSATCEYVNTAIDMKIIFLTSDCKQR